MWFLILSGIVAFLGGILFLFSPDTLRQFSSKINTTINKINIPIDEEVYKLRVGVGISLMLSATLLLFMAYFIFKKYP